LFYFIKVVLNALGQQQRRPIYFQFF